MNTPLVEAIEYSVSGAAKGPIDLSRGQTQLALRPEDVRMFELRPGRSR